MSIKIIECDIFDSGADVIAHQVNCQGAMNSGVAKQIRKRYPKVYNWYKYACDETPKNKLLGKCQFVSIDLNLSIANLFGQLDFGYSDNYQYTDYNALKSALYELNKILPENSVVALPYRIGCCRGGGDWNVVFDIINEVLGKREVIICKLNKE